MKFRPFNITTKAGFVLLNVLTAISASILLVVLMYGCMYLYTDHGVEVEVPNVTGLLIEDAEEVAGSVGLRVMVVDSIFSDKLPRGIVIEQTPPADSHAKRHRYLYVVMNAKCNRQVPVPDVRGLSYRQATAQLEAMNLKVANIVYQPYEHRDLVIDITCNGAAVKPNDYLYEGSQIVLVVGSGTSGGTHPVVVPDLKGKNLEEVKLLLEEAELKLGSYVFDEEPTEENMQKFVVYTQSPIKGSDAIDGDEVAIMLTRNLQRKLAEISAANSAEAIVLEAPEVNEQDTIDDEWF